MSLVGCPLPFLGSREVGHLDGSALLVEVLLDLLSLFLELLSRRLVGEIASFLVLSLDGLAACVVLLPLS